MSGPSIYTGPMATPPVEALDGAIGWTFISEPDPDNDGKWRVAAWRVIFPDHVAEVGLDGLFYRATSMHSPEVAA